MGVMPMNVLAETYTDEYQAAIVRINEKYGVDFKLSYIHKEQITVEEFESKLNELAIAQTVSNNKERFGITAESTMSTVTKTRTKDSQDLPSHFSLTLTYDVTSNRVSNLRNAEINYKAAAILGNVYLTNISSPTYKTLDSGRTATVKYTATVHFDSIFGVDATLYAEYGYDA